MIDNLLSVIYENYILVITVNKWNPCDIQFKQLTMLRILILSIICVIFIQR